MKRNFNVQALSWMKSRQLMMVFLFLFFIDHGTADGSLNGLLEAGQCETFDAVPTACQFIMTGVPVWTAPSFGLTQEVWTAAMYTPMNESAPVGVLDVLPGMTYDCATAYLSLMCPTFFRPCTPPSPADGMPYAMMTPMCYSECLAVNERCAAFFQNTPLNCSQIDPLSGSPQWPNTTSCLAISDLPFPPSNPEYLCPSPLIFVAPDADPNTGLPCATTCHLKLRQFIANPSRDFDAVSIVFAVLNWISFVCVIITLIVYSIFPSNREYPRLINILIGIGLFFVHLGFIGNSFMSLDENLCKSDIALQNGSSWCRFQAWTSYFGALVVVFYWMFNAVVMFWNIGLLLYKNKGLERFSIVYHIFVFTYSFTASMVLMWVPDGTIFGSAPGVPYCFFSPGFDESLNYGLFWWPFFLGSLIIIVCCIGCMVTIARTASVYGRWESIKRRLPAQMTIFLFLLVWLITVASMITLNMIFVQGIPDSTDALEAWYKCIILSFFPEDECQIDYSLSPALIWWELITISTIGLWYSIIYGLINPSQRQLYRAAWKNYKQGEGIFRSRKSMRRSVTQAESSTKFSKDLPSDTHAVPSTGSSVLSLTN